MDDKESWSDEDYDLEVSPLSRLVDVITAPFRALISKEAQKAYLGTVLFLITSIVLLGTATVAYWAFYYNYIPQIDLERAVHLQFGDGYPWGTATLGSELASLQQYDVSVSLHLPRTPENLAAGNFMLDLVLTSPPHGALKEMNTSTSLIAHSRRPAILTYASPLVDTARKLSRMPLYLVGLRREEERLEIRMMENIEFSRGRRNVPGNIRLEIQSREQMQVYGVQIKFRAKFSGLRWLMYNWRILSFFAFTSMFWSVSMITTSIAWVILSSVWKKDYDGVATKKEEEEVDDTDFVERGTPGIKNEDDSVKDEEVEEATNIPPFRADQTRLRAFMSHEDDAGLGTGLDRHIAREAQRRRRHLQDDGSDTA